MLGWLRRRRAARAALAAAGREDNDSGDGDGDGHDHDGDGHGSDERGSDDERGSGEDRDAGDGGGAADRPALAGELDLHTFLPGECADVVEEYVRAAQEAGLAAVRIIHGKGKGTLRRTVHAVLARHPAVASFQLAEAHRGGWGATLVELKPP